MNKMVNSNLLTDSCGQSLVFNNKLSLSSPTMSKDIVLSGIRPTGFAHLGNYFGAIRNWVQMQNEYNCYFCIVDWHSLTTHPDTIELRENVNRVISELLACEIVPEIAELYLYLNMLAYKGELEKTPTFKEKARLQPDNINAGLLTYPVLQAADIIIHRAVKVPVGKDQEAHIEMTRNFAQRFNNRYGEVFPMPYAFNYGSELIKIMSLNGSGKMSKSENQMSTLYLEDDDDLIRKKIMKAKTDVGPSKPHSKKPDYIENLFTLLKLVSTADVVSKFEEDYKNCSIRYGDLKKQLAEDMAKFMHPIREKAKEIKADKAYLSKIIKPGTEKARTSADGTMQLVRKAVGVNYI